MKKTLTLGSLIVVSLLIFLPTVYATKTITAEGTFDYWYEPTCMREVDGNAFLYAIEWEVWEGTFEGTAVSVFTVGMFSSAGFWNVWLRSTFTGEVDGKYGTLVIQLVGKKPAGEDWYGRWVIISGTDDLANLRGGGTWGGPGYEDAGEPGPGPEDIPGVRPDIWYSGQIHFD